LSYEGIRHIGFYNSFVVRANFFLPVIKLIIVFFNLQDTESIPKIRYISCTFIDRCILIANKGQLTIANLVKLSYNLCISKR